MGQYVSTQDMNTKTAESNLSGALEFDIDVAGETINIATTYDPNNRVFLPFLFRIDENEKRELLELHEDGFKSASEVQEWAASNGYVFPIAYFDGLEGVQAT